MGAKRAKEEAERTYKDRLLMLEQEKRDAERRERDEVNRKHDLIRNANNNEYKDDGNLVDEMFSTGNHAQNVQGELILDSIPRPMMDENLDEYIFTKFAATYFQGNASPEYSKKPLKQSLLPLKSEGDQLAALAVWITILRFMGDLPDMKVHTASENRVSRDNTSVMSKIYSTLGRKFNKRDLEEAQRMSEEIVS